MHNQVQSSKSLTSNSVAIARLLSISVLLYGALRIARAWISPNSAGSEMMGVLVFSCAAGLGLWANTYDSALPKRMFVMFFNAFCLLTLLSHLRPGGRPIDPIPLWQVIWFGLTFGMNIYVLARGKILHAEPMQFADEEPDADANNNPTPQSTPAAGITSTTRDHHFAMTRMVLQALLRSEHAAPFVNGLKSKGRTLFASVWDDYGKKSIKDPAHIIPSEDIEVYVDKTASGKEIITIKMPPPVARNETFFVAIVADDESGSFYTYSLELSVMPNTGKVFTMLTGIRNGNRANFGIGPTPDKNAFVAAISSMLETPKEPSTMMQMPTLLATANMQA
ncbi:hypothetical protein ACO0LM_27380 [Undibacterium sp. Di26W]|uniref:hypothetical protein n=1 Tax=Undibacterium sp. Di26W TaxID=3413035 RepID=UPI003BF08881